MFNFQASRPSASASAPDAVAKEEACVSRAGTLHGRAWLTLGIVALLIAAWTGQRGPNPARSMAAEVGRRGDSQTSNLSVNGLEVASSVRAAGLPLGWLGTTGGSFQAIVADGEATTWLGHGLQLSKVDWSEPRQPKLLVRASLGQGAHVRALASFGNRLLVGADDGVHVLAKDADGPPLALAWVPTAGAITSVVVAPDPAPNRSAEALIFLGDDRMGVQVAHLAPDGAIALRWRVPGGPSDVPAAVSARLQRALAPGESALPGSDGVVVPADGVWVVAWPNGEPRLDRWFPVHGILRGLALADDGSAYVCADNQLLIRQLDGEGMPVVGTLSLPHCGRLILEDHVLFVLADGVLGVDVRDASAPRFLGPMVPPAVSSVVSIARAAGGWVAARPEEAVWLRALAVDQPVPGASLPATWPLADVALAKNQLLVARGAAGLQVHDVSAPASPRLTLDAPLGGVFGLAKGAGTAYLATGRGLVRLTLPGLAVAPAVMPKWPASPHLVAGESRLVGASQDRLAVAELSGKAPKWLGELALTGENGWPEGAHLNGVAVYQDYVAYLAAGPAGVVIVDLSVGTDPRVFTVLAAADGGDALSVAAAGSILAVGTPLGVQFYDIARIGSPLSPQYNRRLGGPAARDLAFQSPLLFVAAGAEGLWAIDVRDPSRPKSLLVQPTLDALSRLDVADAYVAALGAVAGIHLFEADPGLLGSALTPMPSPTAQPIPSRVPSLPSPTALATSLATVTRPAPIGSTPTATSLEPFEPGSASIVYLPKVELRR